MPLWASGYRNLLPNRRRMMEAGAGSGAQSYIDRVLGYNPFAYYMLAETSGTTAVCQVNVLQNGTYARDVSVMGTGAGIGDGNTAPVFDGTNDFVDNYSAPFVAAFNAPAGTAATWAKVSGVGEWTDGNERYLFHMRADGFNLIRALKPAATNNTIYPRYHANDINTGVIVGGLSTIAWMHWAITWSKALDEVKVYLNGAQQGATVNGLGLWAGALNILYVCIGARRNNATFLWSGQLAHYCVFDTVLTQPQVADIASA